MEKLIGIVINDSKVRQIYPLMLLEKNKRSPIVLFVRRGIATRYIELEPTW